MGDQLQPDAVSAENGPHDENVADDLDPAYPPRSVLILYATETGTALDAAYRVARLCRRLHFHTRVTSVDVYPLVCNIASTI
jgi:sulfite reductase alpha subunit-like flavoprotein